MSAGQGGSGGGHAGPASGRQGSRRKPSRGTSRPADVRPELWQAVPELEIPEPILAAPDPTALLRSLGPPPLPGQANADQYMGAVVNKAAGLATALALAAGALAVDPDSEDRDENSPPGDP